MESIHCYSQGGLYSKRKSSKKKGSILLVACREGSITSAPPCSPVPSILISLPCILALFKFQELGAHTCPCKTASSLLAQLRRLILPLCILFLQMGVSCGCRRSFCCPNSCLLSAVSWRPSLQLSLSGPSPTAEPFGLLLRLPLSSSSSSPSVFAGRGRGCHARGRGSGLLGLGLAAFVPGIPRFVSSTKAK